MQENKHKHDFDITHLVPAEKKEKIRINPILERLEEKPIPPRNTRNKGQISQRQLDFREALELMEVQKDSILIEKQDRYHVEKAAKRLGYKLTYRVEDLRGIKLFRYWVLSHTIEKVEEEEK